MRVDVFVNQEKMYSLVYDDASQQYSLDVIVGHVGMATKTVPLTDEQMAAFRRDGKHVLDSITENAYAQWEEAYYRHQNRRRHRRN